MSQGMSPISPARLTRLLEFADQRPDLADGRLAGVLASWVSA